MYKTIDKITFGFSKKKIDSPISSLIQNLKYAVFKNNLKMHSTYSYQIVALGGKTFNNVFTIYQDDFFFYIWDRVKARHVTTVVRNVSYVSIKKGQERIVKLRLI